MAPLRWDIDAMKIVNCPLNGPRNAQEFICGGEVRHEPAQDADTGEWTDFVFLQNNKRGVIHEWWCHVATSYWFVVTRDTASESIVATYTPEDFFAGQQERCERGE